MSFSPGDTDDHLIKKKKKNTVEELQSYQNLSHCWEEVAQVPVNNMDFELVDFYYKIYFAFLKMQRSV